MWGCLAKVPVPPPKKVKLGAKTVDCYSLGPAQNSSAYRFLVYKSDIANINVNTIMETRDGSFFEDVFLHKRKEVNNVPKRTREESSNSHEDETHHEIKEAKPRRSVRARTSKTFGSDFFTYVLEHKPQTYKEAMSSSESSCWKEAIKSEIDSILSNKTWKIIDIYLE